MAINTLRGRLAKGRSNADPPPPVSIGEPDAHVFNCPKCSRPLSDGTPRCPGCGTRLILGVTVRRASILIGFGLIIGTFMGAAIASGVITGAVRTAATAVASTVSAATPTSIATVAPTAIPTASPAPVLSAPPVAGPPSAAISALSQTSMLDARMAADAAALEAALSNDGSANDIARVLRSLASDAAIGVTQTALLRTWTDAASLSDFRANFYAGVSKDALNALQVSMSSLKSYRAAGTAMYATLARLVELDAGSRVLASTVNVTLPAIDFGALGTK